jgi:hypothetical protein
LTQVSPRLAWLGPSQPANVEVADVDRVTFGYLSDPDGRLRSEPRMGSAALVAMVVALLVGVFEDEVAAAAFEAGPVPRRRW